MNENIVEISKKNEVAFAIEQNDFADLILNFLGNKEKITFYKEDIEFNIRHNDIEQFFYLLDEKIKKESYTSISHFSLTILYNDNTSRKISGIKALNSFHETRNVIPKAVILSWNIILSFPDSITIENQKVDVVLSITDETSFINITVEHTNSAWGKEVLNLLEEHSKSLIIERHPFLNTSYRLINFIRDRISEVLYIIFGILFITLLFNSSPNSLNSKQVYSMSKIINIGKKNSSDAEIQLSYNMIKGEYSDIKTIDIIQNKEIRKILKNQIIENKKESSKSMNKFFSVLGAIFGFLFIIFLLLKQNIKYYSEKSFILMTTRIEKEYEKYEKSKNKAVYHWGIHSIAFTIIIGLIVTALSQFMAG